MYYQPDHFPCLHCHPHSYIRLVQHLIERCLLLHMTRDQCIKALYRHAGIHPIITFTVWRELLKENRDFFQAYFSAIAHGHSPYYVHIFGQCHGWRGIDNGKTGKQQSSVGEVMFGVNHSFTFSGFLLC
ncbi:uncharacterized protein LOC104433525 isoform X1 [Eucalyptus grandis]|uniref:uncharacterized protein LOC104433525 isoform X1 n=1 Tax=Eucalyptus grandis TaxID=71139 RepID=UPI00192F03EA|nr:uncharacterized protein LOC104433525 isoform X1 [Eucalyptus grandis]